MAEEKKERKLLKLLSTEYAWEGILLLILSIVAIVLGALILQGSATGGSKGLVVDEEFWLIGSYPKAFAWVLIVIGAIALLLSIWPYCKPSIGEVKRVSWPNKKTMIANSLVTIAFIFIFAVLFLGYDTLVGKVIDLFKFIAGKIR